MSEEEEIAVWKVGYIEKGLPEALLDEMIAEANLEWTSELQYSEYDRYAWLKVLIEDLDPTEGCFYLITVQRADWVFQGKGLLEKEWLFSQIPTVEVVIQVFKLKMNETLDILGWGYSVFKHTKEEEVTVTVNTIAVIYGYGNVEAKKSMQSQTNVQVSINITKASYMTSIYEIEVA